jgi:hypothetical protein
VCPEADIRLAEQRLGLLLPPRDGRRGINHEGSRRAGDFYCGPERVRFY